MAFRQEGAQSAYSPSFASNEVGPPVFGNEDFDYHNYQDYLTSIPTATGGSWAAPFGNFTSTPLEFLPASDNVPNGPSCDSNVNFDNSSGLNQFETEDSDYSSPEFAAHSPESDESDEEGAEFCEHLQANQHDDKLYVAKNITAYVCDKHRLKETIRDASPAPGFSLNDQQAMSSDTWAPTLPASNTPAAPGEHPYLHHANDFPSAVDCLNPVLNNIDYKTAFGSYVEAKLWRENASKTELEEDHTIPQTTEQERAMVKVLFKAFKSIDGAVDNHQMVQPFKNMSHDNARVEVVCWQILKACIARAKFGPLVAAYDRSKSRTASSSGTFAERFDNIVQALYSQKTICKHLFDPPFVNTFVDDPVRARSRVESNRALNEKKGKTMAAGKAATGQSVSPRKRRKQTTSSTTSPDAKSDIAEQLSSPFISTASQSRSVSQRPLLAQSASFNGSSAEPLYSTSSPLAGLPTYPVSSIPLNATSFVDTTSFGTSQSFSQSSHYPDVSTLTDSAESPYYQSYVGTSVDLSKPRAIPRSYTTGGIGMDAPSFRSSQPILMPCLNQTFTPTLQSTVPSSYSSGLTTTATSHPHQLSKETDVEPQKESTPESPAQIQMSLPEHIEYDEEEQDSDYSEYVDKPTGKRGRKD
ncbi:MAG: hypothetical protein Q9227_006134 [Pyrenula ochraceoflavens]